MDSVVASIPSGMRIPYCRRPICSRLFWAQTSVSIPRALSRDLTHRLVRISVWELPLANRSFLTPAAANALLPYNQLRGGFLQASLRHRATERTSLSLSFQGGESRAQSQRFDYASGTLGVSRTLTPAWYVYIAGGGGASTVFRNGVTVPWLLQYTGQGGLGYAGAKPGASRRRHARCWGSHGPRLSEHLAAEYLLEPSAGHPVVGLSARGPVAPCYGP